MPVVLPNPTPTPPPVQPDPEPEPPSNPPTLPPPGGTTQPPPYLPPPGVRVVVATSPSTGQVLVRDSTGNMVWLPGTPEQIASMTKAIQDAGEFGTPNYEEYLPPGGGTGGVSGLVGGTTTVPPPAQSQADLAKANLERMKAIISGGSPSVVVVGTNPYTGEVLVKDTVTGGMYWKPGTAEQIAYITDLINRDPEGKLPTIYYIPPSGGTAEKPQAGSLAAPVTADSDSASVYTYRGTIVSIPIEQFKGLQELQGEAQYLRAVQLGILPEGKFVPGTAPGEWGYIPQWQIDQVERFERDLAEAPKELQDAYKSGGVEGYNKAVVKIRETWEKDVLPTMPTEFQQAYSAGNESRMNALIKKYQTEYTEAEIARRKFEAENIKLAGDEYVSKEAYDALGASDQQYLLAHGVAAFNEKFAPKTTTAQASVAGGVEAAKSITDYALDYGMQALNWLQSKPFADQPKEQEKEPSTELKGVAVKSAAWVSTDDFVDKYFAERGWQGGSRLPSALNYTPSQERDVINQYGQRLNEAKDAYIDQYGSLEFQRDIEANLILKVLDIMPVHLLPGGKGAYAAGVLAKGAIGKEGYKGVKAGEYIFGGLDALSFLGSLRPAEIPGTQVKISGKTARMPTGQPLDANLKNMGVGAKSPYASMRPGITAGQTFEFGGESTTLPLADSTKIPKTWSDYATKLARMADAKGAEKQAKIIEGMIGSGKHYTLSSVGNAGEFTPDFTSAVDDTAQYILNNQAMFPDITRVGGKIPLAEAYASAGRYAKSYFNLTNQPVFTGRALHIDPEVLDKFRIVTGTVAPVGMTRTFPVLNENVVLQALGAARLSNTPIPYEAGQPFAPKPSDAVVKMIEGMKVPTSTKNRLLQKVVVPALVSVMLTMEGGLPSNPIAVGAAPISVTVTKPDLTALVRDAMATPEIKGIVAEAPTPTDAQGVQDAVDAGIKAILDADAQNSSAPQLRMIVTNAVKQNLKPSEHNQAAVKGIVQVVMQQQQQQQQVKQNQRQQQRQEQKVQQRQQIKQQVQQRQQIQQQVQQQQQVRQQVQQQVQQQQQIQQPIKQEIQVQQGELQPVKFEQPITQTLPPLPDFGGGVGDETVPPGSIAWASGALKRGDRTESRWWFIPPPYSLSDAIPLSAPPKDAKNANSTSPFETIQVIGQAKSKVPHLIRKDLGWADIEIVNGRTIRFTGGGLGTDVGVMIPDNTKGITIEGSGGDSQVLSPLKAKKKLVSQKPKRKRKRMSEWDYTTTLKGFRP